MFFQFYFIFITNVLIDKFFVFNKFEILILYSYNAFYDDYLKSSLYVKLIVIYAIDSVLIH